MTWSSRGKTKLISVQWILLGKDRKGDASESFCVFALLFLVEPFLTNNFVCLFLAVLGFRCCAGFSVVVARGAPLLSSCGAGASHCGVFSCCGARAPGAWARSCGSWALEHRLNSCGPQAYLLRGMRDLPGSGLEPASPALAGGFSTTEPRGKPKSYCIFLHLLR